MNKIIVLGGGYGGVLTAKKLYKKFKKDASVEITLIDKNPYHTMLTELHEVAAGRVDEDSIRISLKKIFAGRNVNIVLDDINEIDFKEKVLISSKQKYEYDYLVIGTGCKPAYFGIEGAEENSFPLWSYEDAISLKEHILNMFRTAMIETDPEERKKLLTFVVAGAGFTGVEMIGELAEWKNILCEKYHIDPEEVSLYVVDMLPTILKCLPEKQIKKAERILFKLGVKILTGATISSVGKDYIKLGEGKQISSYTCIWTTGTEGSDLIGELDVQQKGRKRIVVNEYLQSVDYDNVYVVGDNMFYIPGESDTPVPQMVENCEHSAPIAASNIYADIRGGDHRAYHPEFHGVMVCMGGRHGVAHVGVPKMMMGFGSFIALFIKHFINVLYFVQVAGWNKVYSYLMHEIFHVKDRRSFVGGYFSKRSPNFWLVPLRMFAGIQWFIEGLNKLPRILNDPTDIFLFQLPGADTTSGASEAVENAAEAVSALPVPEFISNIVDWSMKIFIAPIAPVFQAGMVVAELGIGLMFFGGLFTAPAAVVSAAMCVMIYASGMASVDILWYLFAGIALIGGAGSTFGLDYYVLPFLKKQWKKLRFVRKWYIYND